MIKARTRALEAPSCSTRALAGRSVGRNSAQSLTWIGPARGYWRRARVSADICLVLRMSITSTAKLTTSVRSMAKQMINTRAPRQLEYIGTGLPAILHSIGFVAIKTTGQPWKTQLKAAAWRPTEECA